jgi:hypothetical protein
MIKESLLIRTTEPQLNKGVRLFQLYIYPDEVEQNYINKHLLYVNLFTYCK